MLLLSPFDPPNWPSISFVLQGAICKLAAIEVEKCPAVLWQSSPQSSDQKLGSMMGLSGCTAATRAVRLFGNQWTVANIRMLCRLACEHGEWRCFITHEKSAVTNPAKAGNTMTTVSRTLKVQNEILIVLKRQINQTFSLNYQFIKTHKKNIQPNKRETY